MITKRSSRLTVPSLIVWAMPWPTAPSHWYAQAVSIRRYPASTAFATADVVWSACHQGLCGHFDLTILEWWPISELWTHNNKKLYDYMLYQTDNTGWTDESTCLSHVSHFRYCFKQRDLVLGHFLLIAAFSTLIFVFSSTPVTKRAFF